MQTEPCHVLVVSDDSRTRDTIAAEVTNLGYEVASAGDGRQALEMLGLQKIDLVLLDLAVARQSNHRVLRQITTDPTLKLIPVVVLSTDEDLESLEQCIELGAQDYLRVPAHPVLLKARTHAYLDHADKDRDYLLKALQNAKYERDMQIGREIQAGFLPETLPELPGWEIAAYFKAAREVAGDFYDVFTLAQNRRVGLVIADVCDKGVGPAMYMALIRSLIRAFAQQHLSLRWMDAFGDAYPGSPAPRGERGRAALPSTGTSAVKNAVVLTNNYLLTTHGRDNMFATAFFGVLDPATGALAYVNGGHNPPIFCAADGTLKARLPPTGPAVGMMLDPDFGIEQIRVAPGDYLLIFTDGVPDARNPAGQLFTEKRLLPLVQEPIASAQALLDRVVDALHTHIATAYQYDDITMLAVRRTPGGKL